MIATRLPGVPRNPHSIRSTHWARDGPGSNASLNDILTRLADLELILPTPLDRAT